MSDPRLGCVVIGRNEGERLQRCLRALDPSALPVVYVDSGSTDKSVQEARARQASVVELDMSRPFSAARARNEGWKRLLAEHPEVDAVQCADLMLWVRVRGRRRELLDSVALPPADVRWLYALLQAWHAGALRLAKGERDALDLQVYTRDPARTRGRLSAM